MMRKALRIMTMTAVLASIGVGQARADVIATFEAAGKFLSGASLDGTLTIDATTGTVTAVDLTVGTPEDLAFATTAFLTSGYIPGYQGYLLGFANGPLGDDLALLLSAASLVGYTGGAIDSQSAPSPTGSTSGVQHPDGGSDPLQTGSLTPVPEPADIALFATALLGFGVVARRGRPRG